MPKSCWGIRSKNESQQLAIDYLMDPSIDLVVLEGIAGSGKTLLALAAGLEQVVEQHMYSDILFTRAPIAVGEDMGFLPGTEQDKMIPWIGALEDNLERLVGTSKASIALVETKIKIKAMQFMRGRSFHNKYVIIDEAQNITIGQMKVLLTRAGEGCKIVCLGDSSQVDNKKTRVDNNALSILISLVNDTTDFIKTVKLPDGVRSRLATWAAETM